MTINVILANHDGSRAFPVDDSRVIKEFLEEQGCDYVRGNYHLDGSSLVAGDLNKTFADFGCVGKVYLTSIKKADNA